MNWAEVFRRLHSGGILCGRVRVVIYHGRVAGGVVVLEGGIQLPEGTAVKVETVDKEKTAVGEDPLYRLGELAAPTGIPDLALNIDHYLYAHPKVDDAQQ